MQRHGVGRLTGTFAVISVMLTTGIAALAPLGVSGASGMKSPSKTTAPGPSASTVPSSLQCAPGLGNSSPGVTSKTIKIAAISTLSGTISAGFDSLAPGAQAYFDLVNAHGGVNGRKIELAYNLNDGGQGSRFETLTHTAIDQDHAFAVLVSSYWFSPTYFAATCTPTYGYNVTGNWTKSPNLFAAGGSVQTYKTIPPTISYLSQKVKSKSLAILAYNVTTSYAACNATANAFTQAGFKVSYSDTKVTVGHPNLTPDVQQMKQKGSTFIVSCMTIDGNIALARAEKAYGLKVHQLWLTVANQTKLSKYQSLLQGVYFNIANVPLASNQKKYPGLAQYLSAMKKYEPSFIGDNNATQGWTSAALLVAGIRAAGSNPTQASVVKDTNALTAFTGGGIITPENWQNTHTKVIPPFCSAIGQVKGKAMVPLLGKSNQVFLCFNQSVKNPTLVSPKPGTPGT